MIAKLSAMAAVSVLMLGAACPPALAQGLTAPTEGYYDLPSRVRITPGTARILHRHCDDTYPMDESMPCDTATGGPVGGRGS